MKKRHVIRLYEYYKSYDKLFKDNKIKVLKEDIDFYYAEFISAKSHRKYAQDSEKFFDYLINRLHLLLIFNQFDILIPFEYKGHKAEYEYVESLNLYIGCVDGEPDNDISGKTLSEIEQDFHNFVDLIL